MSKTNWAELAKEIEQYDKKKPKKFSYPKGSIEEAKEQAIKELGGYNENRLGERGSK